MSTRFALRKDETVWSVSNGWQQVLSYDGPQEDYNTFLTTEALAGFVQLRTSKRDDQMMDAEFTYALASSTTAPHGGGTVVGNGLVSRVWTRDVNDVQRRLIEHNNVLEMWKHDFTWPRRIEIAVEAYKSALETYFKGNSVGTFPTEPALPAAKTTATSRLNTFAQSLMDRLMLQDDPTYEDDETVLRKTETVTQASTLKASSTNTKRVHTYAALVRSEPTLPAAALIDAAGLTALKWFKKSPRVTYTIGGLCQIEQEYVAVVMHDEFRYGALIS